MITITGLEKAFGARRLFRDADMQVWARDRIALVGPNGSGKTTLFEMIVGEQEPDGGEVRIAKDVVIGHLRQETDELRGRTLMQEVLSVGAEVTQAGHRLQILEQEMAALPPGEERDGLVAEYGRLQDRFSTLGGYTLESDAKRILGGLGFTDADHERLTDTFSGGWLMRVALAKLLLSQPDLLMLDEPTNHLDLGSVEWLERFLAMYDGAVLLVSHDRDFINGMATKIVEINDSKLVTYKGNYEEFVRQRTLMAEQMAAAAKQQAREIAKTEDFINRFRYKASKAKQVQSRIKALEKIERVGTAPKARRKMGLRFPTPPRAGRVVVELKDLNFGYDPERPVYGGLDFALERDQKVALVGPNGAGKTTLLKLLAGVLDPQAGERRLGHNVNLGYFAQHQIEALEPRNRVMEELQRAVPSGVDVRPRDLLGRFLFSGEDVDKPVSVLSGGERTRLALARLLVQPFNVLCLDEPTNHLDMGSRDVLEDALSEYPGAIVLITHDRHLIRSIANLVVEVVDGRVTPYHGDYDYYLRKREAFGSGAAPAALEPPHRAPQGGPATGPKSKERRRAEAEARARTKSLRDKITRIERELDVVGTELERIGAILADPDAYQSDVDVKGLVQEYERAKKRTKALESSWEEASSALEALTSD
jgi:ATP-binding cassette subfamily F protein 3